MLPSKHNRSSPSEPSGHKETSMAKHREASSIHKLPTAAPSAPRVSKLTKTWGGGSSKPERAPSPHLLTASSISQEKSFHSSTSIDSTKPSASGGERRPFKVTPRTTTPPDKLSRILKPSELQAQLNLVQEELKNAKEHLASIQREKAQVLDDLALAKRLADEASGKLEESLAAQRRTEEALELEKFRSVEWEQSSIDSAEKKKEEWKRKLENIKKRHAEDVVALVSATKELEKVKDELAGTIEAKNSAASHASQVEQIADANARQVEMLTAQVAQLKAFHDSQLESNAKEAADIIKKLESDASELRAELEKAKAFEEKLVNAEELVQALKVNVACAKRAEADANQTAEEWQAKAESLQICLEEVSRLNKSNEESVASLMNNFEECTSMLQEKRSQVIQLKEKVVSLENEVGEYKEGFLETNRRLAVVRKEASELQATIDRLPSEHGQLQEAHRQAVRDEKTVCLQVGQLSQDKNKLLRELDDTKSERDKIKKAVEDLAAALREVSSEAREAKERVLLKQAELDSAQSQLSELKAAMRNAEERHQLKLEESNYATACLRKNVERLGSEAKSAKDEWVSKEAGVVESLKRSEEEICAIRSEMSRLIESLKVAENKVLELKEERTQLQKKLRESEDKVRNASSAAEEAKTEGWQLTDLLSSKEEQVLALTQEVADLRLREMAALAKADVAMSLAEAAEKKVAEEEAARGTDKSKVLLVKLEMDKVMESLRTAEREAKAAKDDKAQLHSKLRQLESKIMEANLTAEESKISSLRLKEMLADKEDELLSIARENDGLWAREVAALAKVDELASLLAEATARKEGEPNGAVVRSPEKQPNMLLKLMCSPVDYERREDKPTDESRKNKGRNGQVEEVKHVEVETVEQVKHEQEISAVEANSLENTTKIIENDLSKVGGSDMESSDDDMESQMDDEHVDQTNGLLRHGPTSSFKQQQHNQKKKKALLKKFGSLLKKKAHFTKMSNHS